MRLVLVLLIFVSFLEASVIKIYNFSDNSDSTSFNWYIDGINSKVKDLKLFVNEKELKTYKSLKAPNKELKTSILFLVDKSIPMKNPYNKGIKPLLKKIIKYKYQSNRTAYRKVFGHFKSEKSLSA